MQFFGVVAVSILAALSHVTALSITAPSAGATVDPGQSITISWTSTSSDPSTFSLALHSTNSNSLFKDQSVGTDVATSRGSYTIPPNYLLAYGSGFVIKATDQAGNILATSSSFILAIGSNQVTTASNGQISLVTSITATASASASTAAPATTTIESSVITTTGASIDSSSAESSRTVTSGKASDSISATTVTTTSASSLFTSSSVSRTSNVSFTTSSASRTTSQSSSGSSVAASTTASANRQTRLGGEFAISAAGIIVGLVALIA